MIHKIRLSRNLLEQIVFGMENQGTDYCLDLVEGLVIERSRLPENLLDTQIPLPPWTPAEGFILMEKFVTSLNNPLYQEELKSILHSGKGVFRKFKNLLKERVEMERLWFRFKQNEMKDIILEWLGRYEEYLELTEIAEEPDMLDDLINSDFTLCRDPHEFLETMRDWDVHLWDELYSDYPESYREEQRRRYREGNPLRIDERNHILAIKDTQGKLASFLWYEVHHGLVLIRSLYTLIEYRGIGLASQLIGRLFEELQVLDHFPLVEVSPIPHQTKMEHLFSLTGMVKGPGSFIFQTQN